MSPPPRHLRMLFPLQPSHHLDGREAAAIGTVSTDGTTLSYTGDGAREFVRIDKEPVTDDSGATVGAVYSAGDTRGGALVHGSPPCRELNSQGVECPFGPSILRVSLGGGDDFFETGDRTPCTGFEAGESCLPVQAVTSVRLDGGPRPCIVDGSRLADTIAGSSGNDAIATWDGNDHVTGGRGVALLETHDGADVAEGGPGNDVIHLDANPLDRDSCFRVSGRNYSDIRRCGPGRDELQALDRSDHVVGCETRFLRPR